MALNTEVHEPSPKYLLVRDGYQQTDVGLIPQEWSVKELRQIGSLSKGRGLLKEDIATSGAVPAIPYTALYTDFSEVVDYGRIKWFVDDIAGTIVVNEPCVLIASSSNMAANTGKASAIPGTTPVAVGREVIIFRTDHSAVFFSYLLSTAPYRKRTLVLARGTTIKHLYPATFANYRVAVPPLAEQLAIPEVLGNVDALLIGLERLIAKKRDIKQATMQQLLTGQTRLPGFGGAWARSELKRLVSTPITDGPHTTPTFYDVGVPFLSVNNLVDNRIDLADLRYISKEDDLVFARKCKPKVGDVLLGKAASVGKVAIVEEDFDFNIWSPIALVRAGDAINAKFFYYQLLGADCADQIALLTNSSSQGNIGMGDIEKLQIAYPRLDEQIAIANVLSDMDAELSVLEARLTKTWAIKQGMMQELLTGRTRLIDLEATAA